MYRDAVENTSHGWVMNQEAPLATDPVVDASRRERDHEMQRHAERGGGKPAGERRRPHDPARNSPKHPRGRHAAEPITHRKRSDDVHDADDDSRDDNGVPRRARAE